jgi:hypothetical protein
MKDYLFHTAELSAFLTQKLQELEREILAFPRDYLLNASEEDLCSYLIDKYKIEPIKITISAKEIVETRPIQVQRQSMWGDNIYHAQGQLIILAVPFEGDPELFRYRPSTYLMRGIEARTSGNELTLQYQVEEENNSQQLERDIESDMSALDKNISYSAKEVTTYNDQLSSQVRATVVARKQVLLQQVTFVQALKIPVRRRDGAAATYAIPSVKRKPRIERPTVSNQPFQIEPILPVEEYEYILNVSQNMAVMLERSPSTFTKLKEEEIRDHFLVQLNGHYEGQATGETFNQNGKTDIIIKENGKNLFIAECKFWEGAKAFPGIIDQLLGYTCWRDTKTAIFLFNKNKDTSKVLDQIPALVKGHANFKRELPGRIDETRFRYMLHQHGDKNRELYLTVCVYDIPTN